MVQIYYMRGNSANLITYVLGAGAKHIYRLNVRVGQDSIDSAAN